MQLPVDTRGGSDPAAGVEPRHTRVTDAGARIWPAQSDDAVLVVNRSLTANVYIGDGEVTTTSGLPVAPLGSVSLPGGREWFAITDTAGAADVWAVPGAGSYSPSPAEAAAQIAADPLTVTGDVGLATGTQLTDLATGLPGQPVSQQVPASFFGAGVDGAVTIAANTTLTGIKQYTDLTINAGVTLTVAGFPIYCTGTVTNNGTITSNGAAGGPAGVASQYLGGGGAGATVAGNTGNAPTSTAPFSAQLAGGPGGASTGAAGGRPPFTGLTRLDSDLAKAAITGGGGGGCATAGSPGGGGGGVLVVIAYALTGAGAWRADGGAGTGTGGGGGGGVVLVIYATPPTTTGPFSAAGGAHGAGGGSDGAPGSVFGIQVKKAA